MFRWENFTTANGLPDNHVFCVLVDGKRIWAGTDNGSRPVRKRQMEGLPSRPMDAWRIRPCSRSRSTSALATSGSAPWADSAASRPDASTPSPN